MNTALVPRFYRLQRSVKLLKKKIISRKNSVPTVTKRERFVIAVSVLSLGLFFLEHYFGRAGLIGIFLLGFLTNVFMYWALSKDIKGGFLYHIFILPFFFTVSFGLYYFLTPNRLLSRLIITSLYGIGVYSLFLSQNIFTVSSIRTIALVSSARIVSFVLTLISYFFLTNVIFSLHSHMLVTGFLVFIASFFLTMHSLWTYRLEKSLLLDIEWVSLLSLCLTEIALVLWFWPSTPTIIALFLTGIFYTIVGISHLWFDKRLFRGVIWEYIWVAAAVFFVLIALTKWG